jgi:nucleotide-binding universal stress UspA family protein
MGTEATPRPVLVATDLSDPACEAIRQAGHFARERRAKLVALHVVQNLTAIHPVFPHLSQRDVNDEIRIGRLLTDRLSDQVYATVDPDVPADVVVDFGVPDVAIVRRAEEIRSQLVVVGSRGATGLERLMLGSVAERVVRHAPCSVLVARPGGGGGTILAATDLSSPALPAVEAAARLARERSQRLTLIHVLEVPSHLLAGLAPLGPIPNVPDDATMAQLRAAATTMLEDMLARFEVEGDCQVVPSHRPAAAIVAKGDEIDAGLIVTGTHGHSGIFRMTLGSVAERVVSQARCSVLLVRLSLPKTHPNWNHAASRT